MIHSTSTILGAAGKLETKSWKPVGVEKCAVGIVHGLGEHSGRYQPVAGRLVQEGCHVVGYDQRGHGRTGGSIPTFPDLLDDLAIFVAHLKKINEVVFLYGQSLGGGLVVNYALRNSSSIRGAIASSPLLRPTHAPPSWKLLIARTLGKLWPSMTLGTGIQATTLTHDLMELQKYRKDPLVHHRVSAALGITMLDAGEWAIQHAPDLNVPMLLMHGSADEVTSSTCSAAFAAEAGPICNFRMWEGLYHDLHFETEKEQVLTHVANWISTKCATE